MEQWQDGRLKLVASIDDRPAQAQCARRLGAPGRIWPVQRVEVPGRPLTVQHFSAVPVADHLLFVPEVSGARVGHAVGIPSSATIADEHVEPHCVHAQVRVAVLAQNVLLDPTGPLSALWSSRRDEHDQPWLAGVLVEHGLKVRDVV
jgi:hypothetical protein